MIPVLSDAAEAARATSDLLWNPFASLFKATFDDMYPNVAQRLQICLDRLNSSSPGRLAELLVSILQKVITIYGHITLDSTPSRLYPPKGPVVPSLLVRKGSRKHPRGAPRMPCFPRDPPPPPENAVPPSLRRGGRGRRGDTASLGLREARFLRGKRLS